MTQNIHQVPYLRICLIYEENPFKLEIVMYHYYINLAQTSKISLIYK